MARRGLGQGLGEAEKSLEAWSSLECRATSWHQSLMLSASLQSFTEGPRSFHRWGYTCEHPQDEGVSPALLTDGLQIWNPLWHVVGPRWSLWKGGRERGRRAWHARIFPIVTLAPLDSSLPRGRLGAPPLPSSHPQQQHQLPGKPPAWGR